MYIPSSLSSTNGEQLKLTEDGKFIDSDTEFYKW